MKNWKTLLSATTLFNIVSADLVVDAPPALQEVPPLEAPLPADNLTASLSLPALAPEPAVLPSSEATPPALMQRPYKSPLLAATLSSLLPGLGHTYLDDLSTAGSLFGSSAAFFGTAYFGRNHENLAIPSVRMFQAISSYGVYAAYRDARAFNVNTTYSYKMPRDSFKDLAFAPFSWSTLKKPEVWGGILGGLGLAVGVSSLVDRASAAKISSDSFSADEMIMPMMAFPIGISEEALFRGFLQSQLSEAMNPWAGITLSSLLFGAAHIPNAQALEEQDRWRYYSFSLPLITGLGAYFGWITYKNQSLKESVAVHAWYDFALFASAALATEATASTGPKSFAIAIPF